MIGYGRMQNGWYVLETSCDGSVRDRHALQAHAASSVKQQLMQWRQR